MELKLHSNPKYTNNESIPISYTFKPGVTALIGSNGSGKSTVLRQIHSLFHSGSWSKISYNDNIRGLYSSYYYNNEHEQKYRKQSWLEEFNDGTQRLARTFENSEGQNMWDFLYYQMQDIGKAVNVAKNTGKKGIFLLFDAMDSGLSLDKLYELKSQVFDFIIHTERDVDLEVYIVCSTNSYEFVKGYDCIDVTNQKHISFNTFEEYEQYFIGGESN